MFHMNDSILNTRQWNPDSSLTRIRPESKIWMQSIFLILCGDKRNPIFDIK